MGWKSDSRIRDLEPYAKKHGYEQVIVIGIKDGKERYEINTYGKTKSLCDQAKSIGDTIADLVRHWWL